MPFDPLAPATALINRISDAIGVVYNPTRIIDDSAAETEAAIERAKEVVGLLHTDVESRAARALIARTVAEQLNMESIVGEATKMLTDDAEPNDISLDWLASFADRGRKIYSKDMQMVWAKLLAQEAHEPGVMSKSILHVLSLMDPRDSASFTSLMGFVAFTNDSPLLMVGDGLDPFVNSRGIDFQTLSRLEDLGLVASTTFAPYQITVSTVEEGAVMDYWGTPFVIPFGGESGGTPVLRVGFYRLTHDGELLAESIGNEAPVPEFPQWAVNAFGGREA